MKIFKYFFIFFLNFSEHKEQSLKPIKQVSKIDQSLDCEFYNVLITLGDSFHTFENIGKSHLKINAISQLKCKHKPGVMIIFPSSPKPILIKFQLNGIYLNRFIPPDDNTLHYYLRYTYIANIEGIENVEQFSYFFVQNYENPKQNGKTYFYQSNILKANSSGNYKGIILGDLPLDLRGKNVIEELKKTKYDILFILGDLAYDLQDNFGLKGDQFFQELEPIISKIPVCFINGNHDMNDDGRILNFRFRSPGAREIDDNNFQAFEIAKSFFFIYNTDFFNVYKGKLITPMMERIKKILQNENQLKWIWKFLMSHRPLNCFDYQNEEACFLYNHKFWKEYIKLANETFDYHFSGHVHLYERIKQDLNDAQGVLSKETVIVGTGGQLEDISKFTTFQETGSTTVKMLPLELGFLILNVKNFYEIEGQYFSIKEKVEEGKGNGIVKDTFRNSKKIK